MTPAFVNRQALAEWLALNPVTIWRLANNPESGFPKPLRFGRAVRWRIADVEEYLAEQQKTGLERGAHSPSKAGHTAANQ